MAIVEGDKLKLTASFSLPYSSAIQNVYHFAVDGTDPVTDSQVLDAAQSFLVRVYNALDAYQTPYMEYLGFGLDVIQFVTDHWETFYHLGSYLTALAGWTPVDQGNPLPPGVSGMAALPSIYPRRTGRKYFDGFTESDNTANQEESSNVIVAIAAAGGESIDPEQIGATDTFLVPVILHSTADLYNLPLYSVATPRWAYQRRRKRFVGA